MSSLDFGSDLAKAYGSVVKTDLSNVTAKTTGGRRKTYRKKEGGKRKKTDKRKKGGNKKRTEKRRKNKN